MPLVTASTPIHVVSCVVILHHSKRIVLIHVEEIGQVLISCLDAAGLSCSVLGVRVSYPVATVSPSSFLLHIYLCNWFYASLIDLIVLFLCPNQAGAREHGFLLLPGE